MKGVRGGRMAGGEMEGVRGGRMAGGEMEGDKEVMIKRRHMNVRECGTCIPSFGHQVVGNGLQVLGGTFWEVF